MAKLIDWTSESAVALHLDCMHSLRLCVLYTWTGIDKNAVTGLETLSYTLHIIVAQWSASLMYGVSAFMDKEENDRRLACVERDGASGQKENGDCAANNFLDVTAYDCNFNHDPHQQSGSLRILRSAWCQKKMSRCSISI